MHLRQFSRVRKTRKIYDAEFHTLMGWSQADMHPPPAGDLLNSLKMHYLLGLL